MIGRRSWLVRGGSRDITLVLGDDDTPSDPGALDSLIWRAKSSDAAVADTLREVAASLRGGMVTRAARGALAEDDADELRFGEFGGFLRALRAPERTGIASVADDADGATPDGPVLGPTSDGTTQTFVALVVVDQDGKPVKNERYKVITPDGSSRDGRTDDDGKARLNTQDPGDCHIDFPLLHPTEFWPSAEMPDTGKTITVASGDHGGAIASQYRFGSFSTISGHPKNSDFAQNRPNPDVLFAGDKLFIPDRKPLDDTFPTGKEHRFRIKRDPLTLRMRVVDLAGKPLANTPCTLEIGDERFDLTTDGDGAVEKPITADITSGRLIVGEITYELDVGFLDPVSERSGLVARLNNLGYDAGEPDDTDDEDDLAFAIQLFQFDNGLAVDGERSPALESAVESAYGA